MAEEKKEPEAKKTPRAKKLALELRAEATEKFSTLIASAFGLVAAFAWNEVVKDAISRYISSGSGLRSKLIYAILVTLFAIAASFQLGRLAARYKTEAEDGKE